MQGITTQGGNMLIPFEGENLELGHVKTIRISQGTFDKDKINFSIEQEKNGLKTTHEFTTDKSESIIIKRNGHHISLNFSE